jgi:hypothetical protein
MARYAAKLLFQYRVDVDGGSGKRRVCEQRIINFDAKSPHAALAQAKCHGQEGEHSFTNTDGNDVNFQFVGVLDLLSLGVEADARTVWYEVKDLITPMERREKLLPTEADLLARLSGSSVGRGSPPRDQ